MDDTAILQLPDDPILLKQMIVRIKRESDAALEQIKRESDAALEQIKRESDAALEQINREAAERIEAMEQKHKAEMDAILRRFYGPRSEAFDPTQLLLFGLKVAPDAVELDVGRWEQIIRRFEILGQIHVILTNGAATLESFGSFGNFSTFGEYFTVQTKSLDMHIRHAQLAAIFAVEKPGHMDGVNTLSFQFYDQGGTAAFKVFLTFGGKAPPSEIVSQFNGIREEFRLRR